MIMSTNGFHKRMLARRGKLFNKEEMDNLYLEIERAIESCKLYESAHWRDVDKYCCLDDSCNVHYSTNKKYQITLRANTFGLCIKEGTQIMLGQGCTHADCVPTLSILLIPDSVQAIAKRAFSDCRNLQHVVFGRGLKIIQEEAFANCNLKSIFLPEGLYSIGDRAFANNPELETVYVPYTVQKVGKEVFSGCEKLSIVYVDKGFKESQYKLFSDRSLIMKQLDYTTWDEYNTIKTFNKSSYVKPNPRDEWYYEEMRRKDFSDEENWNAVTDGMYDYPVDIY